LPAAKGPDRSIIEKALAALCDALSEIDTPWMIIGGIAVIAHGVQRMTTDIDAVIQGDRVQTAELLAVLHRHRIAPRVANAEAFADTNLVLLARHLPTQVDLDLSFGWTAFESDALASSVSMPYGTVTAPMARVEELLVFKAIAGRSRDVDDAVTLLTLYPHTDLVAVRRRVTELAALAEAPELLDGFDEILRALRALPTGPTPIGALPSVGKGRDLASKKASAKKASAKKASAKKAAAKKRSPPQS
jgi:hypothetical protein